MTIRNYADQVPVVDPSAYVDPQAHVSGSVNLAADVSIWPMAVLRGDVQRIEIGRASNIQDGAVLHVTHDSEYSPGGVPLIIGEHVTVGHNATLHACTIRDESLIGMGSIVLDEVVVESQVMVGAGAVVTPGKILESGFLYVGSPAKKLRPLSDKERDFLRYSAQNYVKMIPGHRDTP